MIEIRNLSIKFKNDEDFDEIINNFNLVIEDEDIIVLLGSSGSGKSTILSAIGGINKDYEGSISINSEMLDEKKHLIGYIPQNYGLLPWKTVYQNCLLPFIIRGYKINDKVNKEIVDILKKLNLYDHREKYPKNLSGGQKQRVSIARTLLLKPDLLLMDEPFSALDAITKEEACNLFLNIWKDFRCSTIIVTHSIDEALTLGNKIVVLSENGNIKHIEDNKLFDKGNLKKLEDYEKTYENLKSKLRAEG